MMRQWILGMITSTFVAATVVGGTYNKVLSIGDKAPSIAPLPSVFGNEDTTFDLANVKEDVVVVAFLASHCEFTRNIEKRLIDLVNSYKGKSVKVVGVNCSPPEKAEKDGFPGIKKRIKAGRYNIEYACDPSGKTATAFGATATPEFFVFDRDRKLRYTGLLDDSLDEESKVSETYVKTSIDSLLAGKEIKVTETKAAGCRLMERLYKR